jgi:hypothetical protein
MPLYKTGIDMFEKYRAKYNPTVIGTRFSDVSAIAQSRAQSGLNAVDTIRSLIRDYLDAQGITGGTRATYLGFALELWRMTSRQKGVASDKIATGLIAKYKNAFGLVESYLTDIANAIIVKVTPSS